MFLYLVWVYGIDDCAKFQIAFLTETDFLKAFKVLRQIVTMK